MVFFYDKILVVMFMKVLTIKQPFATLIAEGIKCYEFRTWKTKYRGDILIHAGKGIDKKAMEKYKHFEFHYPSGCILAKVTLCDCIKIDEAMRENLRKENEEVYSHVISHKEWEGFGFQLKEVQKIEPVYVKGRLSFWNYEGEIVWKEK